MASWDELTEAIAAQPRVENAVELLIDDLAARIKATSNDQNIQRLARDLKQQAPALARAFGGKQRVGAD